MAVVKLMRGDLRKMLNLDALGEQSFVHLRWLGEDEGDEKTPSSVVTPDEQSEHG
jgi:hypothetical protein